MTDGRLDINSDATWEEAQKAIVARMNSGLGNVLVSLKPDIPEEDTADMSIAEVLNKCADFGVCYWMGNVYMVSFLHKTVTKSPLSMFLVMLGLDATILERIKTKKGAPNEHEESDGV
jgi:hypothetical protein